MTDRLIGPVLERFVKESERVASLDRRIGGDSPIAFTRSYGYIDHLVDALAQTGPCSVEVVDALLRDRAEDIVHLATEWIARHPPPSSPLPSGICLRFLALLRVPEDRSPAEQKRLLIDLGYGKSADELLALLGTAPPEASPAEEMAEELAGKLGDLWPGYRRFVADSRASRYDIAPLRDGFSIYEATYLFRKEAHELATDGLVPLAAGRLDGVVALFLLSVSGAERGKVFFWWDEEAGLLTEVAPSQEMFSADLFAHESSTEWPWELFVNGAVP